MIGSALFVTNTVLSDAEDFGALGKGIQCQDCDQVFIKDTSFRNLKSLKGGAIFLKNTVNAVLQENSFDNNIARQGGAIYIENSQVTMKENVFESNEAISSFNL